MAGKIDKRALLAALREELQAELARSTQRALDAAEAATHEENRAEGDKDMRSTEASYVARGQAERVREIEHALAKLGAMGVRDFADGDAIEASAIVEVEHEIPKKTRTTYFLVTAGGGVRLKTPSGGELLTLATTSPLGAALLGLTAGDEAEVSTPQGTKSHTILRVS
jgi:transcription elongation GreA/GreB family factor